MARSDSILPGSTNVSHLKRLTASISMRFAPTSLLAAGLCSAVAVISSGCAIVQIPSYRLEECAVESCESPPVVLPSMPAMPAMPMPGWLARWKAEKDLPKPPEAPRFHPLPTRPMFQPQPSQDFSMGAPGEAGCYGTLPRAQSWNGLEAVPAIQAPTAANPLQ